MDERTQCITYRIAFLRALLSVDQLYLFCYFKTTCIHTHTHTFICDIDDQNTKHMLIFKGILVVYWILNLTNIEVSPMDLKRAIEENKLL